MSFSHTAEVMEATTTSTAAPTVYEKPLRTTAVLQVSYSQISVEEKQRQNISPKGQSGSVSKRGMTPEKVYVPS